MKVELLIVSLALFVACTAQQYELKCTRDELGIRWPIYEDNTKYYFCLDIGTPVVMTCPAGLMFTFVSQSCTLPEYYIEPPQLTYLPTDAPSPGENPTTPSTTSTCGPTTESTTPGFTLPTPPMPSRLLNKLRVN